jgi:hypothetical protein
LDFIIDGVDVNGGNRKYESGLFSGDTFIARQFGPFGPAGLGLGIGNYNGGTTSSDTTYSDLTNFGLNSSEKQSFSVGGKSFSGLTDSTYMPALKDYLNNQCSYCKITITSFASPHGNLTSNQKLATDRTETIANYLTEKLGLDANRIIRGDNIAIQVADTSCKLETDRSSEPCKKDRSSQILFEYDRSLAEADPKNAPVPVIVANENITINTKITNRFYNESNWFEKLQRGVPEQDIPGDYFVFDRFRDKIKYFHPAFHSTTPEGLNSRLTFLHQCTRQGPTLETIGPDNLKYGANNLAFGRAPICILRVGDFYHTKIVIDNLSINYEPIVWDLNPEGIGVQPMIANVTLSFKFLGGSSLAGPINRLQNALSFNYYANAHVYDVRADYVRPGALVEGQTNLSDYFQTETTETSVYTPPTEDQIAASEIESDGLANEPSETPSGSTEAKITGFSFINVTPTSTANQYSITIGCKQEGIVEISNGTTNFILDEEQLLEFASKGIKLTIEFMPIPNANSRFETIVNQDENELTELVNGVGLNKLVELPLEGEYIISIFYNGNNVSKQIVSINNNDTVNDFY